jgi:pyruvate dehydrogenase E2 component (dihydrolipoamide acetyltransferase)
MSAIDIKVPDIGDFKEVEVIEVLVKVGDVIRAEQSLITVETDKASMEIPSSAAGKVLEVKVKVGAKISEGAVVLVLEAAGESPSVVAPVTPNAVAPTAVAPTAAAPTPPAVNTIAAVAAPVASVAAPAPTPSPVAVVAATATTVGAPTSAGAALPHASPSVRKFARELGVNLSLILGSGPKERITVEDVRAFVKVQLAGGATAGSSAKVSGDGGAGLGLIPWPKVDFSKFGSIESKPLSRIKKISGANLHRNWVMIPHVTNHDDADITELEAFRVQLNKENEKSGVKVTMLAFLIKACVNALKKFPDFNSSLDGENLVFKQYFHIGFAADTPNGLMVPVVKDADKKGIFEIAKETSDLALKAREGKLSPAEMQGGCFSISSLGGIGGTYFTPIINAPEVAILGVCRASTRPVWNGTSFEPRLILPLSLSWDHRVIDGASAARFNTYLAALLADFRRVML